jgi:glutathione S-transferase
VMHLPALWIFAIAWGDLWAGILGFIFVIGRILYALGYYEAAEKRGRGFGIASLATIVLTLGALMGALAALF